MSDVGMTRMTTSLVEGDAVSYSSGGTAAAMEEKFRENRLFETDRLAGHEPGSEKKCERASPAAESMDRTL